MGTNVSAHHVENIEVIQRTLKGDSGPDVPVTRLYIQQRDCFGNESTLEVTLFGHNSLSDGFIPMSYTDERGADSVR